MEPRARLRSLRARPLNTTFGRQVQAARAVWGPHLEWDFAEKDIAAALTEPPEFYAERDRADIAYRVTALCKHRRRNYGDEKMMPQAGVA